MDLPWGLTNTSGHLPLKGFVEFEYSTRYDNDNDEIMGKLEATAAPSMKAKRRIRRRLRSGNMVRLTKTGQSRYDCLRRTNTECATGTEKSQSIPSTLSFSSWGHLDTNSAHFIQLTKEEISPTPPIIIKNNVQDRRLTRKSSWAQLEIELDDDFDPRGYVDSTPQEKRGSSAGLNINSGHSRSSWAGLDIFGEIDIKGYQSSTQDETECTDNDIDGGVHPTHTTEAESDTEDEDEDDESDETPQEQVGRHSWLDFDLDELSESESDASVAEDDASDSEEGENESDTEDDLTF
jgi:hypothetical protein